MTKLILRMNGKEIFTTTLSADQEYIAGRSKDADIPLSTDHKISRQHLRFFHDGNNWQVELLSRYGEITFEGKQTKSAHLIGECRFQMPPFDFELIPEQDHSLALEEQNESHLPVPSDSDFEPEPPAHYDDEVTFVGKIEGVPFIRITDKNNQNVQTLRLEGNFWDAGRDSMSAIHINDMKVSRNQFQILSTPDGYFVKDLGSVNGTLLNGNSLRPNDPQPLKSGDIISVLDHHFYFEIRDPQFSEKLQQIDQNITQQPALLNQQLQLQSYLADLPPHTGVQPLVQDEEDEGPYELQLSDFQDGSWKPKMKNLDKKSKIRVALAALIVVIFAVNLMPSGTSKPSTEAEVSDPFSKLSPEDQEFVKRTHVLAKNLYIQGKYELAASEIAKIHEKIEYYEDSEQILEYATEAIKIREEKKRIEQARRETMQLEEEARGIIAGCTKLLENKTHVSVEAVTQCLSPAMDRVGITAEDHPLAAEIQDMIEQAKAINEDRQRREAEAADYRKRVALGRGLFNKAEKIREQGKPHKAIAQYRKHIGSSYPDPSGLKSKSKNRIASIEKSIQTEADKFILKSEEYYEQQDLRASVEQLDKALSLKLTDDDLERRRLTIVKELRKRMQILYQESILEESLGNIESAKDRWLKIIELDIPKGEYSRKSRIKMKKYGGV